MSLSSKEPLNIWKETSNGYKGQRPILSGSFAERDICHLRYRESICTGCLILIGHFPQKRPILSGSFAERDICHLRYRESICTVCLILIGHFPQKRPIFSGSFAERDMFSKRDQDLVALLPSAISWEHLYRVANRHRTPYLDRSFSTKETYIWWLFCGKRHLPSAIPWEHLHSPSAIWLGTCKCFQSQRDIYHVWWQHAPSAIPWEHLYRVPYLDWSFSAKEAYI